MDVSAPAASQAGFPLPVPFSFAVPVFFIFIGDTADHPAWIACCNAVGRDILNDHRTGPDHYVITDNDTRADSHIAAEPYIIADRDWERAFQLAVPGLSIYGVVRGQQVYPRAEEYVVADRDGRNIKENAVHIRVEITAYADI